MGKYTLAAIATIVVSTVIYNKLINDSTRDQWEKEVNNAESEMNSNDNA